MRIELYNTTHKTSVKLNLPNGEISNQQIARVRKLCPVKGYCSCNRWYHLYDNAFLDLTERKSRWEEEQRRKEQLSNDKQK